MPRLVAAYWLPLALAFLLADVDRSFVRGLLGMGLYALGLTLLDRHVAGTPRRRVGLRVATSAIPVVMLLAGAGSDLPLVETRWPVVAVVAGLALGTVVALLEDGRFSAVARRVTPLFGPAGEPARDDGAAVADA